MIKSGKQLTIAKERLNELTTARAAFERKFLDKENAQYRLGIASLNGMIENVENEIEEYETLKNNVVCKISTKSIEDLPHLLIKTRIAKKMSQSQLAEIIGIDAQTIQRYEATDYESVSWTRIVEVILALGVNIKLEKVHVTHAEHPFLKPSNITNEQLEKAKIKIQHYSLLNI
jgi:transcriptional regulator with XRE-family HTH domain